MGIMENNRQMIRAIRAIRNLFPIGIPFKYYDLLNDIGTYSRYPFEYDYDSMALVRAIESLIISKEIIKDTDTKMLIRVKGIDIDIYHIKKDKVLFQETVKTLNANEIIA